MIWGTSGPTTDRLRRSAGQPLVQVRTPLVVAGGQVLQPGGLAPADVVVRDGLIEAIAPGLAPLIGAGTLDATGLLVAPGFIDTQVNGAFGIDLTTEPERMGEVAAALPQYGVTSFLPTVISSGVEARDGLLDALAQPAASHGRAALALGAHFEGPMLNQRRAGAHPASRLCEPSLSLVERWSRHDGVILVTLAPELTGALEVVRALVARGVVVAAGHTDAATDEVLAGLDAGVTHFTHLFNAMRPLHHRDPGPVGVALTAPGVTAGLIADGVHLHPRTAILAWAAMGRRLNLVSDAVAALGQPGGAGPAGVTNERGQLAGADVALDQGVRNLVAWTGCSTGDAVATVTSTPADLLGRTDKGRLVEGAHGDLVLLTPDLDVVATVIAGVVAHDSRSQQPDWAHARGANRDS
jgi:N-acetylglucosamine-6-phosphate deacetylase